MPPIPADFFVILRSQIERLLLRRRAGPRCLQRAGILGGGRSARRGSLTKGGEIVSGADVSRLHSLAGLGQSIWIDSISRDMLDSGGLDRRLEEGVTGVTSNPTIFAQAVMSGRAYDGQIAGLAARGADAGEIYTAVVTSDIQRACDVMEPVHRRTGGRDGFVSVEVSPELARRTEPTVAEAREWVKRVNRPNLLVKVPATREGIPAIEALTAEGVSVNVTLIFSLSRYRSVIDAYLSGLQRFAQTGGKPSSVASVASFFVSRFDTEVDARLEKIGGPAALALRGRGAVANARAAYLEFLRVFTSERWRRLHRRGAGVQRPLWASTSTKNPDYPDTLYVEALAAPSTVNTMPESTIAAYQARGPRTPSALGADDLNDAASVLEELAAAGVDYDGATGCLEREGVDKFLASFREMMGDIERKRAALVVSRPGPDGGGPGA